MVRYFNDFEEGDKFTSSGRTVTEADLVNYAGLSGNFGSIHMDAERMKDSSFEGRIAHGYLIVCLLEGLRCQSAIGRDLVETNIAMYSLEKTRFIKPVYIGDTITNEMTVVDLEEYDEKSGLITIEEKAVNQKGKTVLTNNVKLLNEKSPTE